ncbi:MAG: tRNA adenosine(34) deaminase TadA [Phycisphaeraceae bacterium]
MMPALNKKLPLALCRRARTMRGDDADIAWMRRAIALAQRAAQQGEVPVGAIVVHGDRIIGEGFNRREMDADPVAHAEIAAIQQAAKTLGGWRLNECTLVVTLEPCPMCAGAMVNARVGRLVYGASDTKMGAVKTLYQLCNDSRLNHRVHVTAGVLTEECGKLLSEFFTARRKLNRREGAETQRRK